MPPPPEVRSTRLSANKDFAKSFVGILRILQIALGAGLWITIATNKYDGSIHFVLFVAVVFWLLTLAIYIITLLDKQNLVFFLGGDRWLLSNAVHDLLATVLYSVSLGIMIYKTEKMNYCTLQRYKHSCLYKVYLIASVFAGLSAVAYLITAVYNTYRKCKGNNTVI
ncbi:MARVEL domain-containing protein 1 [Erpetoichthys calabaricus]|uniref:MARVEL domain containing 1 n=1 Tax=Erpetoichthys calabaricus TaxID=27687 RepID=A0A8C4REF3_ERPCA|nr:MARVEL domain-containing protein 1 [Erpetoichthys calabaricus]